MTTRLFLIVPLVVMTVGFAAVKRVTLKAQAVPVTKNIAWDQNNAVSDGISDFTITFDGVPRTVTAATACTPDPQKCQVPQVFPSIGNHSISVVAQNVWGVSTAALLTVTVTIPRTPSNVTIK